VGDEKLCVAGAADRTIPNMRRGLHSAVVSGGLIGPPVGRAYVLNVLIIYIDRGRETKN